MSQYIFPQVTGGYRWNMLRRIADSSIGLEPFNTGDIQVSGVMKTVVEFTRDLTTAEQTTLTAIMADNPTQPPATTGTKFSIDDMWEKLAAFRSTTGVQWRLYFRETTPGSGLIDLLELQAYNAGGAPVTLTTQQKNQTRNAFAALIREA